MTIERTTFGSITIEGITYEHDVVIDMSGKVHKRKKKLSKDVYGTSHIISLAEARHVYEKGCEYLVIGAGQDGLSVRLSGEAEAFFGERNCRVVREPTPQAIGTFNESDIRNRIGLFHVTC